MAIVELKYPSMCNFMQVIKGNFRTIFNLGHFRRIFRSKTVEESLFFPFSSNWMKTLSLERILFSIRPSMVAWVLSSPMYSFFAHYVLSHMIFLPSRICHFPCASMRLHIRESFFGRGCKQFLPFLFQNTRNHRCSELGKRILSEKRKRRRE